MCSNDRMPHWRIAVDLGLSELKGTLPATEMPGSYVNIKFAIERGFNLMEAVQVVREPPLDSPFDPVPDDGHL